MSDRFFRSPRALKTAFPGQYVIQLQLMTPEGGTMRFEGGCDEARMHAVLEAMGLQGFADDAIAMNATHTTVKLNP